MSEALVQADVGGDVARGPGGVFADAVADLLQHVLLVQAAAAGHKAHHLRGQDVELGQCLSLHHDAEDAEIDVYGGLHSATGHKLNSPPPQTHTLLKTKCSIL